MTKRNKLTLIGSLAFMLFLLTYAAYAYLNSVTNINNLAIDTEISGPLTFTATGGNDLSLKVNANAMDKGKVGDVVAEGTDTMTITLETDGLEGICCSYDIIWEWDKTDNEHNQYHKSKDAINEYTISASVSETYLSDGTRKSYPHDNPVMKVQVPDYNSAKLSTSIYRTSICNNTKELTTEAKQEYTLNTKVYNLNVPQDSLRGAKLASKVRVDNVSCKKQITLSDTVIAEANNNNQISSQDGSDYIVKQENVTYNSQTLNAGIRYEGSNPDNYITFNDEEWRIIGVFEGSTIGLEAGKQYTKIVASESIGEYNWDEGGENDWVNSTLYAYLNGEYLNNLIDKDKIAAYSGKYSQWYLLGAGMDDHNEGYNAIDWYIAERYTGRAGYKDGVDDSAVTETNAAIGLMYPSDWGLAIYSKNNDCNNQTAELFGSTCYNSTWIFVERPEWLISPNPDLQFTAYCMFETNVSSDDIDVDMNGHVRPTLYLEYDVMITGGSGAKNDPYTIDNKKKTLSEEVMSMVSDSEYTSSQDGTAYIVNHEEVEYNGETLDAGIRYEGVNPDNYVMFNNELWRIIGTFEGSTIGLEPGKQYTKIIGSEPIGFHAWDENWTEHKGDWISSSLNEYLNSDFLLTINDKNKIAQYNGNFSSWYLRAPAEANYEMATTADWYLYERFNGVSADRYGFAGEKSHLFNAAIALMYASDYGYAAYGEGCTRERELYSYEMTEDEDGNTVVACASVDWLLLPDMLEWIISHLGNDTGNAYLIGGEWGGYVSYDDPAAEYAVRPVLYLEHDIEVTGGTGSKEYPYELATPERNLSEAVINSVSNNEYTSSQDNTKYVVRHEEVKYEGTTYDAGIRYEGTDPDNYVQFNGDEEWRIIGVFEGGTIGLEPGKQYTKIIRSNSIGSKSWDHEYDDNSNNVSENDWTNSTLNLYLNNDYLNGNGQQIIVHSSVSVKSLDATAKNMIGKYNGSYSTWYLRGATSTTHSTATTPDWYLIERYSGGTGYRNKELGAADATIQSAIALMYPSDYGYAAYGDGCTRSSVLYRYEIAEGDNAACGSVDWLLLKGYWDWFLSPNLNDYDSGFIVYGDDGGGVDYDGITNWFEVRPTLYLKADTMITSGSGTKLDPYILN